MTNKQKRRLQYNLNDKIRYIRLSNKENHVKFAKGLFVKYKTGQEAELEHLTNMINYTSDN